MDEKQVSKLLKDITTGALRRRRGADDDLDLDDSDDERVARRRAKQREFARMRKALLADDKIGEIASNPKTQAFFKAIEDRDSDDDMDLDFLENKATDSQNESSQDIVPESQPTDHNPAISGSNKRKRPLEASADDTTNRPPPNLRRTKASAVSKKPATLAEIRESVSFLIETPEYDTFREDASADEDEHDDDVINDSDRPSSEDETPNQLERRVSADGFTIPPNPRRSRARVVDRLALLRAASSNSATSNKAAFMSSSSDALPQIGFRPPAFLRRSTTNSSSTSLSSTSSSMGSTTTNARPKTGPLPGMSNAKKGAVNYYTAARERERERELQAKESGGASNIAALLSKQRAAGGGLGALMGKGSWE
jgi:mediator of replication checkpoint protein 1